MDVLQAVQMQIRSGTQQLCSFAATSVCIVFVLLLFEHADLYFLLPYECSIGLVVFLIVLNTVCSILDRRYKHKWLSLCTTSLFVVTYAWLQYFLIFSVLPVTSARAAVSGTGILMGIIASLIGLTSCCIDILCVPEGLRNDIETARVVVHPEFEKDAGTEATDPLLKGYHNI